MTISVLIVDDDAVQRQMMSGLVQRRLGFVAGEAENGRDALYFLESPRGKTIKLVILDLDMPVMNGMETLDIITQTYPHIATIMMTGSRHLDDAIKAMKLGAVDFINKPCESDRMMITIQNALKIKALSQEVKRLKNEQSGHVGFDTLIGHDGGLAPYVIMGRKAASSDIPVLITGATGTGKELFAKAIHGESIRKGKPFIAINCGAIPAQLVESTLFGHKKGAFTGATEETIGKFREADGGTIFLDEVGELPLDAQVKLLRVLQQKEVEPVGTAKPISINVRIISATNRSLDEMVSRHHFREDLYFRLNVLHITLPLLQERVIDIPLLAQYFVERFAVDYNKNPKEITPDLMRHLMQYPWPGNVRQLENIINRAMVMSDGPHLDLDDCVALFHDQNMPLVQQNTPSKLQKNTIEIYHHDGSLKTIREIEGDIIARALDHFDHNVTRTAKALGVAKSTFYKKVKDIV